MAAAEAVDHDLALRVDRSDLLNGPPHQRRMDLARHAVLAEARRLVEQVEAEILARYALVAPREGLPLVHEAVLRHFVEPEVIPLEIVAVDTVARAAVDIQAHVQP